MYVHTYIVQLMSQQCELLHCSVFMDQHYIPGIDNICTRTHPSSEHMVQEIDCTLCGTMFCIILFTILCISCKADQAYKNNCCSTNNAFLFSLADVHSIAPSLSPTVTKLPDDQNVRCHIMMITYICDTYVVFEHFCSSITIHTLSTISL